MTGPGRLWEMVIARLDRRTAFHRVKDAESIFYLGRPHPVSRLWSNAYFAIAAGLWARRGQNPVHLEVFARGLAACRDPRNVLDIGTGGGGTAALASSRWPDARIVATDLSRRMLRAARAAHPQARVEFTRATSHELPFRDGGFDLVVFLNSVANPLEIARVTSDGAQLLIASLWPSHAEDGAWIGRWRDAGFDRVRAEDEPGGSWELYEKRRPPRT